MINKFLLGLGSSSLLLLSQTTSAAVVEELVYEDKNFVQATRFTTDEIQFSNSGEYKLTLSDANFGSHFDSLMVTITNGTETILSDEGESFFIDYSNPEKYEGNSDSGVFSESWTFQADAGNYFLTLWAEVGDPLGTDFGYYGVRLTTMVLDPIVTVPLPPALVFLGSALIPLASFSRRKRHTP